MVSPTFVDHNIELTHCNSIILFAVTTNKYCQRNDQDQLLNQNPDTVR